MKREANYGGTLNITSIKQANDGFMQPMKGNWHLSNIDKLITSLSSSSHAGFKFILNPFISPQLCYTYLSTFFEIGASMKIHKTVNPVAYENTYYLEGESTSSLSILVAIGKLFVRP